MENNCDNILKIMKESFNQIEVYKNKRYNVILQTIEEKIDSGKNGGGSKKSILLTINPPTIIKRAIVFLNPKR